MTGKETENMSSCSGPNGDGENMNSQDLGVRCRGCGGNIPGRTMAAGPSYHVECRPRDPTPLEEYRRVVEMWANYRFRCSDTPSPPLLDKLLAECDDATTALITKYGFTHMEREWLCAPCHYAEHRTSAEGVAAKLSKQGRDR